MAIRRSFSASRPEQLFGSLASNLGIGHVSVTKKYQPTRTSSESAVNESSSSRAEHQWLQAGPFDSFPDITQEIIMHPHRSEPLYVAHGRKEILQRYRLNGSMSDLDCEKMIIILEPQAQLKNKDKFYIKHIPQELKRNYVDPRLATNSEKLTAKLMILCGFLIKRTEDVRPDPNRHYPYMKDLHFIGAWEKGLAPWQINQQAAPSQTNMPHQSGPFAPGFTGPLQIPTPVPGPVPPVRVPFVAVPFPAMRPIMAQPLPTVNQIMVEIPVWKVKEWYKDVTNAMIMKPHFREPVYVAIARRDILFRERTQGMLNDNQTQQLLESLTFKFFQHETNIHEDKVAHYNNLLGFSMANVPNITQLLSIKLMATCDFLIERCQVPISEKKKNDIPYPCQGMLCKDCPGPYPGRFLLKPGWPHIGGIPLPIPTPGSLTQQAPAGYTPTMEKQRSVPITSTLAQQPVVHAPVAQFQSITATSIPNQRPNLICVNPIVIPDDDESEKTSAVKPAEILMSSVLKPDASLLIPDEPDENEEETFALDPQLPDVAHNGQYEKFDPTQLGDKLAVQNYIVVLAAQNEVCITFSRITVPGIKFAHQVHIGAETYTGKSNNSGIKAKRNVSYETLMRTKYSFVNIPDELKKFKPKRGLPSHVIIGAEDPGKRASSFVDILASENKVNKEFEMIDTGDGSHIANLTLGTEVYYGTGMSEESAQQVAAYAALQKTSYIFTEQPDGIVSKSPEKTGEQALNAKYQEVKKQCTDLLVKRKQMELDESATVDATRQLKQTHSLSAKEIQIISKKLSKLATLTRKAKIKLSGWKWWRVTKHLEYTADIVLKKLGGEEYDEEKWVEEANFDPDYIKKFTIGTIDLTDKPPGGTGKAGGAKDNNDEMDIYEDVMKLDIPVQPLDDAIVLSDEEDGSPKDQSENTIRNKTSAKAAASINGEKQNSNSTGKEASTKYSVEAQNVVSAQAAQESLTDGASPDHEVTELSDDDNLVTDQEMIESTARTRLYVRKRKLDSNSQNVTENKKLYDETTAKKISSIAEEPKVNSATVLQKTVNKEQIQTIQQSSVAETQEASNKEIPSQKATNAQTPQKPSPEIATVTPVEAIGEALNTQQDAATAQKETVTNSTTNINTENQSNKIQLETLKPRRHPIGVSAASIAAGVLSGLGVTSGADSSDNKPSSQPVVDQRHTAIIPHMPLLEPEDLTLKPMEKRYEAMKKKVEELLERREKDQLSSIETGEIIRAIKEHLTAEDMARVNKTTSKLAKQHFKTTGEKTPSPAWKLTVRLKVLARYILHKLQSSVPQKGTEEKKAVNDWLKGKAVEYYKELSSGSLTNEQMKERVEALKLNLSPEQMGSLNVLFMEECKVILSMLSRVGSHLLPVLKNVVDLELTSLYVIQQQSGKQYPVCCLMAKTFADIMLAKLAERPVKISEALKVIKAALDAEKKQESSQGSAAVVMELDSTQVKELNSASVTVKAKKPAGIKLTLTSITKSNIEAEKRQQSKRAAVEAQKDCDNDIVGDSDSD